MPKKKRSNSGKKGGRKKERKKPYWKGKARSKKASKKAPTELRTLRAQRRTARGEDQNSGRKKGFQIVKDEQAALKIQLFPARGVFKGGEIEGVQGPRATLSVASIKKEGSTRRKAGKRNAECWRKEVYKGNSPKQPRMPESDFRKSVQR